MRLIVLILVVGGAVMATPAALAEGCSPRVATSRVFTNLAMTKAALNSDSWIGTSWSLLSVIRIMTGKGLVYQGTLYSPRGGTDGKTVFVPADDWDCGSEP